MIKGFKAGEGRAEITFQPNFSFCGFAAIKSPGTFFGMYVAIFLYMYFQLFEFYYL